MRIGIEIALELGFNGEIIVFTSMRMGKKSIYLGIFYVFPSISTIISIRITSPTFVFFYIEKKYLNRDFKIANNNVISIIFTWY